MIGSPSKRLHGFDWLRAAAILAVVFIHGCDTNAEARRNTKWLGFAVPCFFMISAYLAQRSFLHKDHDLLPWLKQRFLRLAPPFYLWTGVYLAARIAKSAWTGVPIQGRPLGWLFWGDASYHLYFVPLLFYCLVVWAGLMKWFARHRVIAVGLLLIATIACFLVHPLIDRVLPDDRWFIGKNLIWFPIGMLTALLLSSSDRLRAWMFWPSLAALAAMYWTDVVNVYALSYAAFTLALSIESKAPTMIRMIAAYSFGIYLVHVLVIETLQFMIPRLGYDLGQYSVTLANIAIAAILSYLICLLLGNRDRTRWSVT